MVPGCPAGEAQCSLMDAPDGWPVAKTRQWLLARQIIRDEVSLLHPAEPDAPVTRRRVLTGTWPLCCAYRWHTGGRAFHPPTAFGQPSGDWG